MGPYKVISEDATHVTYEYRTAYTWMLYAALMVLVIGITLPDDALYRVVTKVAWTVIIVYFVAKLGLGIEARDRIRKALQSSSVQVSGNRYSFSNPLRIRVPKSTEVTAQHSLAADARERRTVEEAAR